MKRALRGLLVLALAAALGLLVRQFLFATVRIEGSSMEDTLCSGDVVLVLKVCGEPNHGDVVQCAFPGRSGTYVKRLVGLPGDTLEFQDGALTRSGYPVSEPYVSSVTEDFAVDLGENEYFALGDNRAESYDSRSEDMGVLSRENILGRVRWILWPLNRFGPVE